MFKFIGKLAYSTAEFLIKGKVLNKTEGAEFLKSGDAGKFISSRNKGLLLDGVRGRLSVPESFQNVCFTRAHS